DETVQPLNRTISWRTESNVIDDPKRADGATATAGCNHVTPSHSHVSASAGALADVGVPPNITMRWRAASNAIPAAVRSGGDVAGVSRCHAPVRHSQVLLANRTPTPVAGSSAIAGELRAGGCAVIHCDPSHSHISPRAAPLTVPCTT